MLLQSGVRTTHAPSARSDEPPATARLGYLLSQYPAISHTFFLQEVLGLRARGMHIETASINRTDRPFDELPVLEAKEARNTTYIKDGRPLRALLCLFGIIASNPSVLFRGLRAISMLRDITLWKRVRWVMYLAEALLVGRWLRLQQLTHLHVHFGGPVASVGLLTSVAWQIPYSLTIHGPEELLDAKSYLLREKLAQASFVFCISDFCRSQLYAITPPAEWYKFSVSRLGVDPLVLTPITRSNGFCRAPRKNKSRFYR